MIQDHLNAKIWEFYTRCLNVVKNLLHPNSKDFDAKMQQKLCALQQHNTTSLYPSFWFLCYREYC